MCKLYNENIVTGTKFTRTNLFFFRITRTNLLVI
jgi:hypothetical protein